MGWAVDVSGPLNASAPFSIAPQLNAHVIWAMCGTRAPKRHHFRSATDRLPIRRHRTRGQKKSRVNEIPGPGQNTKSLCFSGRRDGARTRPPLLSNNHRPRDSRTTRKKPSKNARLGGGEIKSGPARAAAEAAHARSRASRKKEGRATKPTTAMPVKHAGTAPHGRHSHTPPPTPSSRQDSGERGLPPPRTRVAVANSPRPGS